jgi:fructokinase
MKAIYGIGETTYDIVFKKNQPQRAIVGGSVLNTSVSLGRLGLPVHFISSLGNDKIGDLSIGFLIGNGVNIERVNRYIGNSRIALAFMDEKNNAEYQFYNASQSPQLQYPKPTNEDIILFGSTNATQEDGRNELLCFLNQANANKSITIYDPNIRESDKNKLIGVRQKVEENMRFAKILKGSDQDFMRLYETSDAEKIFEKISHFGIKALIVTAGEKPVHLITNEISKSYPINPIKTVSTIGAGDNFTAGTITGFCKHNVNFQSIDLLSELQWNDIIDIGISFASEVCKSDDNYISTNFASTLNEQFLKI